MLLLEGAEAAALLYQKMNLATIAPRVIPFFRDSLDSGSCDHTTSRASDA